MTIADHRLKMKETNVVGYTLFKAYCKQLAYNLGLYVSVQAVVLRTYDAHVCTE